MILEGQMPPKTPMWKMPLPPEATKANYMALSDAQVSPKQGTTTLK